MNDAQILERIQTIFHDVLDDDSLVLRPETTAHDVEDWDSLAHIQLLVAIERAFEVRFNTGEVAGLANVGEMVSLLVSKIAPASEG